MKEMEHTEVYKYLWINDGHAIKHAGLKKKNWKECYWRVHVVLATELNP